ncbi:MAG: PorT family protein [Bacteroidetes bacterium]|nr:MAG: PorT family protein [Bacteroidota bacterium]
MKKLYKSLILVLAAGLFSTTASAQAFWGIYGGINTANMRMGEWKQSSDPLDTKPTFEKIRRLTFGVSLELPFSDYFILQPELAFTQKGTILSVDSNYGDILGGGTSTYQTVNNLDLNYLQLPILAKTRFQLTRPKPIYPYENSGKPLFIELYGGPVVNFLLNPRANYSQTIHEQNALTNIDTTYKVKSVGTQAGMKRLDISFAVGANLKWKWNKKSYLYLDVRYSLNFLNVNDSALVNIYTNENTGNLEAVSPTLKNSGNLALTIGINTTFTKRRYWNHPRVIKRKF